MLLPGKGQAHFSIPCALLIIPVFTSPLQLHGSIAGTGSDEGPVLRSRKTAKVLPRPAIVEEEEDDLEELDKELAVSRDTKTGQKCVNNLSELELEEIKESVM